MKKYAIRQYNKVNLDSVIDNAGVDSQLTAFDRLWKVIDYVVEVKTQYKLEFYVHLLVDKENWER